MKKILIYIFVVLCLSSTIVFAEDIIIEADNFIVRGKEKDVDANGNVLMRHKKIKIIGSKANYVQNDRLVTLWGNVVLTYKKAKMTADKIVFDGDTQIAKAYGNVKYFYEEENVKGQSKNAILYSNEEKIVMNGNVNIWQNEDSIVGDIVDIFLADKKIIARGRTTLTISPETLNN